MIFRFEAFDAKGVEVLGEVDRLNETQALRELKSRNLTVISLSPNARENAYQQTKKASLQDLVMSFHEMVTLLEAGVSISDTIESQCMANYPRDLSRSYKNMAQEVRKGSDFATALQKSGLNLPKYMRQFAKAGEISGDLAGSLRNGLKQFEYQIELSADFKSTLTYPFILFASGVVAVLLIFAFVIPKFLPMLERSEDLPLLSIIVFKAGIFFNDYWLILCAFFAVPLVVVFFALKRQKSKEILFDVFLGWPFIGSWLNEVDIARWCSTMAALLSSKVDLLESISLSNEGVQSLKRRNKLDRVIQRVRSGGILGDALEEESVLTPVGYNLIRSGEKTGQLASMISSLAKLYDEGSRTRMKKALSLIEPLSILVIGAIIGCLVVGVMLAITSVNLNAI